MIGHDECSDDIAGFNCLRKRVHFFFGSDRYFLVPGCIFLLSVWFTFPTLTKLVNRILEFLWVRCLLTLQGDVMQIIATIGILCSLANPTLSRRNLIQHNITHIGKVWSCLLIYHIYAMFLPPSLYEEPITYCMVSLITAFAGVTVAALNRVGPLNQDQSMEQVWRTFYQTQMIPIILLTMMCTCLSKLTDNNIHPSLICFGGYFLVGVGFMSVWYHWYGHLDRLGRNFITSAERGDIAAMKQCVALGANVNFQDPSRRVVTSSQ
jgi:hypothetical protein